MINNTEHKVQVTEISNLSTSEGDVYDGGEYELAYQYAYGSDYTLTGHGKLTYSRCEELLSLARGHEKPIANDTRIGYNLGKDLYYVTYDGSRILHVTRYGWFIYPNSYWQLNPGYTGRIKAYTGVEVYKCRYGYKVCYGGVTHSMPVASSNAKPVFVDFSYRHKHGLHYTDGPTRAWHTHLTGVRDYHYGYWSNDNNVGRKYAMLGTEGRRHSLIQSVVDGYVNNYLKSWTLATNRRNDISFESFCETAKLDYTTHNPGSHRVVTRNAQDWLPEYLCNDVDGAYRFLNAKLLYNIDTLAALNPGQNIKCDLEQTEYKANPRIYPRDAKGRSWINAQDGLSAIGDYSVLFQSMLAMRGLNFVPNKKNCISFLKLVNSRTSAESLHDKDETYTTGFKFKNLCSPTIDKFRFSFLEHSGEAASDYFNRHKQMLTGFSDVPDILLRRGFITKFMEYMCSVSSGGLDKPLHLGVTQIRQLLNSHPNARSIRRSGSHFHGSGTDNQQDEWVASPMYSPQGMYTGRFVECPTNEDTRRYRYSGQSFTATWRNGYESLSNQTSGVSRKYGEPFPEDGAAFNSTFRFYRTMRNPYPRIIFFLMFDEYCANSMYDKQQLLRLLSAEWAGLQNNVVKHIDSVANRSHSWSADLDMRDELPLTWEIMHKFLTNRISGLFLPLVNGNKPGESMCHHRSIDLASIYGLEVLDRHDTGQWYYNRNRSSPNIRGSNVKPIHLD